MFLKRSILVAAALTAFAMPALAADLPVKARPLPAALMYPTAGGFFYGITASGIGGSVSTDVVSGALFGGNIGVNVGYTGKIGNTFWFAENSATLQGVNAGNSLVSIKPRLAIEQRIAVGAPMNVVQQWTGLFPGLSSIAMPSVPPLPLGVTMGPQNPYVFLSLHEDDVSAQSLATGLTGRSWLVSWGGGPGLLSRLSNGMMLDLSAEYVHASSGVVLGAKTGTVIQRDKYQVTASVKF